MTGSTTARTIAICVIGLGPRGLTVLERILATARRATDPDVRVDVHLVDPRPDGAGVHRPDLPDYLLLNTVCGQLTIFPDQETVDGVLDTTGPNLHDWVTTRGDRVAEDGYGLDSAGRPITAYDFLPRRLLGEYLSWSYERMRRSAPANVLVHRHQASAVDLSGHENGFTVVLSDGGTVLADFVFLTTGHTGETDRDRRAYVIDAPYPLPSSLDPVRAGQTVACSGFGLTAIDVLCALTVGRGGRFVTENGQRRYVPSGQEPRIVLFSRTGRPYRARPVGGWPGPRPRPSVFTPEAIVRLRETGKRLDFRRDVLPLIHAEMRAVYHQMRRPHTGSGAIEAFDPASAVSPPMPVFRDTTDYQRWVVEAVEADLREARRGLAGSPLKAALEVLRDLRDVVRAAVDFGGIDAASLEDFAGSFVPAMNRNVIGPQAERHEDLLALIRAGVVSTPMGPEASVTWDGPNGRPVLRSACLTRPYEHPVDWICRAHVRPPSAHMSSERLLDNMCRRGFLRPYLPDSTTVRGVDICRDGHPIGDNGRPVTRMWLLGPLSEGATFYNHYVPSPGPYNRAFHDAHRYVRALFAFARANREEHPPCPMPSSST